MSDDALDETNRFTTFQNSEEGVYLGLLLSQCYELDAMGQMMIYCSKAERRPARSKLQSIYRKIC